jgi:hypothetical protein
MWFTIMQLSFMFSFYYIVLHQNSDDGGKGGDEASLTIGNSGKLLK